MSRLIAAIDTADPELAARQAAAIGPHCGLIKLGLEFFIANGPAAVLAMDPSRVFLDLKLHDIPQTVRGAVRAAAAIGPAMLTVHASGGPHMIAAAREGLDTAGGGATRQELASRGLGPPGAHDASPDLASPARTRPALLAVTVLTSIDTATLAALGIAGGMRQHVLRLGRMAIDAGADGLVCSAHETRALRALLGPEPILVVPGIRPRGTNADDQARVMTPGEAVAEGADWIVVGRPILSSPDPAAAARAIGDELDHASRAA